MISRYIKRHSMEVVMIIVLNVGVTVLSLLIPYITGQLFDELISEPSMQVIYRFCCYILGSAILMLVVNYLGTIISTKLRVRLSYEINLGMIRHIQKISLKITSGIDPTYLNQRLNSDINTVVGYKIEIVTKFIINTIKYVLIMCFFAAVHWGLAIIVIAINLLYVYYYVLKKKKLEDVKMGLKEGGNSYYKSLQEQIQDIKAVRAMSMENVYRARLKKRYRTLLSYVITDTKMNFGLKCSESLVVSLSQIAIFVIGGYCLINGSMTVGVFTILINYLNMIVSGVDYYIEFSKLHIDAGIAGQRIREYSDIPEDVMGNDRVDDFSSIEVNNLSFSYVSPVLDSFSYIFIKGKSYAICGENGAGKSTLVDVLTGMYPRQYEGCVLVDGIDLDVINPYLLRKKKVVYSIQKAVLCDETLKDNIVGRELYDSERYNHLIDGFRIKHLANKNENGQVVGGELSGGELQKIALARALYRMDADIYVFDEPTNNLDSLSKEFFGGEIKKIKGGAIVIVITHDEDLIEACDEAVMLTAV